MKRLVTLFAISALLLSTASAETWFLARDQEWKQVSPECEQAYLKANTLLEKGKFTKAYRAYEKSLEGCDPNSELYAQAMEKQFYIGSEYLSGRKKRVLLLFKMRGYAEGVRIMERIEERAGDAPIAVDAAVEVARSYEQRGKRHEEYYDIAHLKWSAIFENYDKRTEVASSGPTGDLAKDALLAMARCKHNAYTGPVHDASTLAGRVFGKRKPYDNAKACYKEFKSRYGEAEGINIDQKLAQVNEQLALKDLCTADYYQRTGSRQAANLYYQMVTRDWPGTKPAEKAKEMLINNLAGEEAQDDQNESRK
ncbi:MAG: hypothetical protein ACYS4W_05285 [Planctomycetota bacterium]